MEIKKIHNIIFIKPKTNNKNYIPILNKKHIDG